MPRRVLVTRPGPQAAATARRLAELGYEPLILPLTQTVALAVDAASLPDRIDAVAVTSANALRSAPAALLARLAGTPCFAVGEKTARQARSLDFSEGPEPGSTESEHGDPADPSVKPRGFSSVEQGSGDAEALADLVIKRLAAGASVVYPCGRVRLSAFEARLADAGIAVHAIETYDTPAIDYSRDELSDAIGTEPVDAVLLYSARAARQFSLRDWPQHVWRRLEKAAFLCLSRRVAEELAAAGSSLILVAKEPMETSLLLLLERLEH